MRELQIPAGVESDENATEMVRFWLANGEPNLSLLLGMYEDAEDCDVDELYAWGDIGRRIWTSGGGTSLTTAATQPSGVFPRSSSPHMGSSSYLPLARIVPSPDPSCTQTFGWQAAGPTWPL